MPPVSTDQCYIFSRLNDLGVGIIPDLLVVGLWVGDVYPQLRCCVGSDAFYVLRKLCRVSLCGRSWDGYVPPVVGDDLLFEEEAFIDLVELFGCVARCVRDRRENGSPVPVVLIRGSVLSPFRDGDV